MTRTPPPKDWYLSLNKFIDDLKEWNIIKEGDYFIIYFDNYHASEKYKNSWSIEPIGFAIKRGNQNIELSLSGFIYSDRFLF